MGTYWKLCIYPVLMSVRSTSTLFSFLIHFGCSCYVIWNNCCADRISANDGIEEILRSVVAVWSVCTILNTHQMWEVCFFTDEDKAVSIIGNDKIESLQIVCYFLLLLYTIWEKNLQVNCVKIDFSLVAGYLLGSDFFL